MFNIAIFCRCIKLGSSNVASDLIILGSSVNIPAKDACHAPSLNMIVVLDLESNIRLYSGSVQVCSSTSLNCLFLVLLVVSTLTHFSLRSNSFCKIV